MATRGQWAGVRMVAGVVFVLGEGCASIAQTTTTDPSASRTRFDRAAPDRRQTLTATDLSRQTGSALDAIQRLRPEFFVPQVRSATNARPQIALYLDDVYDGDVSGLMTIPLDAINEVEFVRPVDALIRFGARCRCEGGAIVVRTRNTRPQ
jgi:hypothetical protein